MRHGQTNGIPQGSVLMDFIAEMVLGYSDVELTQKISDQNVKDYCILRYRDDYRIFVNSSADGERILKSLTEVMMGLGLKLNPAKTKSSSHVVRSSIKEDKLSWISRRQSDKSIQKHLLIIHNHSADHPNAGSLAVALKDFYNRICTMATYVEPWPLISIVVDIAYRNPRTYAICAAILSKLISFLKTGDEKRAVVTKTRSKFSKLPNTGHMQIWLQRVSYPFAPAIDFDEPLCRLVCGQDVQIWNSEWVSSKDLREAIDAKKIVKAKQLKTLDPIVPQQEVVLFAAKAQIAS